MLNPTDFDRLSLTVFFSTSTVFECVNLGSDKHLCHTELVECETATNHYNNLDPTDFDPAESGQAGSA